jgi:enoyl-CoA hydratase
MSGHIRIEIKDGVGTISIDRPEKMNAMTGVMKSELAKACGDMDADPTVRCIVLTSVGEKAFCVGSDLNELAEKEGAWAFRNRIEYAKVVRDLKKPVVAALRGWVLGGGLEMALAADIRVAGASAKLGLPEVKRGWLPGGGASQMLPRLVGYGQAMMLMLTGEPISAEAALRIGLVEEVVAEADVEARATAIAKTIATYSPIATQSIKAAVRIALSTPLEAGLQYENELHVVGMQSRDREEGVAAFQGKRPASFSGT